MVKIVGGCLDAEFWHKLCALKHLHEENTALDQQTVGSQIQWFDEVAMGKLHTLRRAIRRNPKAFMTEGPLFEPNGQAEPRLVGIRSFCSGARFQNGQWEPVVVDNNRALFPYRALVRATLTEMGYDVLS